MGNNLSTIGALGYQGTNAVQPPNIWLRKYVPTARDYQNYQIGDFWVYVVNQLTNTNQLYVLLGTAENIANWVLIGGSHGNLQSLTANSGGTVYGDSNQNINVRGDGTTINVVGDPSTNTLTISATNAGDVTGLETDDGHTVTPTSGVIVVAGGTGIATTGTVGPNTVTISTTGAVATSYVTDSGTAIPASGILDVNGGTTNVATSGAGHQVKVGLTGITQHSLQVGGASNALTQLGVATNGQLPIGSTGADPVLAPLTAGTGISITNGAGSITINGAALFNSSAFLAEVPNDVANFGTIGSSVIIPFSSAIFDTGSNYNAGTYKYTAPATGTYVFYTNISAGSSTIGAGNTEWTTSLVISGTSARTYVLTNINSYAMQAIIGAGSDSLGTTMSMIAPMTAGDTAEIDQLLGPGGASGYVNGTT